MVKALFNRIYELRNQDEYKVFYKQLSVFWDEEIDIDKFLSLDDEVFEYQHLTTSDHNR